MKEIEIDMKAKTPDASMLVIESDQPEQVETQPQVLSEDILTIKLKSCLTKPTS